jgi:acetyl esterase/lipase
VATWIAKNGGELGLDTSRIAIAGDFVGGNMTAALTLMAKQRGGDSFVEQVLFYPVTDASFDTGSYHQFAEGYFLRRDAMQWFWDQYTTDPAQAIAILRLALCTGNRPAAAGQKQAAAPFLPGTRQQKAAVTAASRPRSSAGAEPALNGSGDLPCAHRR